MSGSGSGWPPASGQAEFESRMCIRPFSLPEVSCGFKIAPIFEIFCLTRPG